jgi:hypothetical protein
MDPWDACGRVRAMKFLPLSASSRVPTGLDRAARTTDAGATATWLFDHAYHWHCRWRRTQRDDTDGSADGDDDADRTEEEEPIASAGGKSWRLSTDDADEDDKMTERVASGDGGETE